MRSEVVKAISKKIFVNLLILIVILFMIIAITGIPLDFNIITYNGISTPNMTMSQIGDSIKTNFRIFLSGQALSIKVQGDTVGQLLLKTAGKSAVILVGGAILALIIGIPKGIIDSRKRDRSGTLKLMQSLIPLSIPDILTVVLVQLGALYLYKNQISFLGLGVIPSVGDANLLNAIYPIISMAVLPAAYISRVTATTIEENFEKPFVLAARGKGCSRFQIIKNHMMKSIGYEILSSFPTIIGIMFSTLIVVERLFFYRGMGFYLIFLYTTDIIKRFEAGIAFTTFIVALAIFYYIIFMIFNMVKDIILPKVKAH